MGCLATRAQDHGTVRFYWLAQSPYALIFTSSLFSCLPLALLPLTIKVPVSTPPHELELELVMTGLPSPSSLKTPTQLGRIRNSQNVLSHMQDLQNQQQLQTLLESKRFEKRQGKLKDVSFEFSTTTVQAGADETCFSEVTETNVQAVLSIPEQDQQLG